MNKLVKGLDAAFETGKLVYDGKMMTDDQVILEHQHRHTHFQLQAESAIIREEVFENRPHLVVPVIMLVEGIVNNELAHKTEKNI